MYLNLIMMPIAGWGVAIKKIIFIFRQLQQLIHKHTLSSIIVQYYMVANYLNFICAIRGGL